MRETMRRGTPARLLSWLLALALTLSLLPAGAWAGEGTEQPPFTLSVGTVEEFRAVDTTGAGDNFLAGVIYGLLHDEPLGRCVRLGNIFAGKSTTAVGCFGAAVTPALIREYL